MNKHRSPIEVRCHRASSWIDRAGKLEPADWDGRFIFYWIAFNSLYGQPKYLEKRDERTGEGKDIGKFLNEIFFLDPDRVRQNLNAIREDRQKLMRDHFLCDECWKYWHNKQLHTAGERQRESCSHKDRDSDRVQLFARLYVLRKQLFHGCSKDRSTKNREMLKGAVLVLGNLVPLFRDIVQIHGTRMLFLNSLPYPPSVPL